MRQLSIKVIMWPKKSKNGFQQITLTHTEQQTIKDPKWLLLNKSYWKMGEYKWMTGTDLGQAQINAVRQIFLLISSFFGGRGGVEDIFFLS